ncbi:MAG: sulfurtransferase-like selenium metabolism protein YedF [Spirochaetota bacterium]|nr:sulfurtransferase-like selenium metabolism protein YedF [Spirochaetota bacterium]
MAKIIDAQGLSLPEPIILIKNALENNEKVEILVDSKKALRSIKQFVQSIGYNISYEKIPKGVIKIVIEKTIADCTISTDDAVSSVSGPTVVLLRSDRMGQGDDELGDTLMKAFIHTLLELTPTPEIIILYNSGVKLAIRDTQTSEDLQIMIDKGSTVLLCGTCVNYFQIGDSIGTGTVSNMYNIAETIFSAGRIVSP